MVRVLVILTKFKFLLIIKRNVRIDFKSPDIFSCTHFSSETFIFSENTFTNY